MLRKLVLPVVAILGLIFCIYIIFIGAKEPPVGIIIYAPPQSPYKNYVAGVGIIESVYKNIPIGVPFADVITEIYVKVGDVVQKGFPLFKLDTRSYEAQLIQAMKAVQFTEIDYENKKTQFSFYKRLTDKSAVSEQAYSKALYSLQLARQAVENAHAQVNVIKTNIERSYAQSPIDGEVLQINIRVGQFANVNPFDKQPLILFGDTSYYHIRIDIDEEDAWRMVKETPATAFVRGNANIFIPLQYVYTEPYIIPKQSLSGSNIERVDTRVLQVVYRFPKQNYPVFVGELLDVYIEAKPNEAAR